MCTRQPYPTDVTDEEWAFGWATRHQVRQTIFEWIEVFYERQRRHSALGYLSPEVYEAQFTLRHGVTEVAA